MFSRLVGCWDVGMWCEQIRAFWSKRVFFCMKNLQVAIEKAEDEVDVKVVCSKCSNTQTSYLVSFIAACYCCCCCFCWWCVFRSFYVTFSDTQISTHNDEKKKITQRTSYNFVYILCVMYVKPINFYVRLFLYAIETLVGFVSSVCCFVRFLLNKRFRRNVDALCTLNFLIL